MSDLSTYAATASGIGAVSLPTTLEITSGTNTISSGKTVSNTLTKNNEAVIVDSIPSYNEVNKKTKVEKDKIKFNDSSNWTTDTGLYYSNGNGKVSTLSVNTLSFGTTGKIKGVETIEFSDGSLLKLPSFYSANSCQVLVYLNGNLVWQDVGTIISKENKMNHVYWTFTDYLSIFLIALLAIWTVKHISWKIILTPLKKMFKFGKKKVKEAEEELKKAEEVWKDIE